MRKRIEGGWREKRGIKRDMRTYTLPVASRQCSGNQEISMEQWKRRKERREREGESDQKNKPKALIAAIQDVLSGAPMVLRLYEKG